MKVRNKYECYHSSEGLTFTQPTKTQPQFKDDCDINVLYDRYKQTGVFYPPYSGMPHASSSPVFADLSSEDFGDMMVYENRFIAVREAFEKMPQQVKERFNYDPMNMARFLSDKSNFDEAVKLGLLKVRDNNASAPSSASPSPSTVDAKHS